MKIPHQNNRLCCNSYANFTLRPQFAESDDIGIFCKAKVEQRHKMDAMLRASLND